MSFIWGQQSLSGRNLLKSSVDISSVNWCIASPMLKRYIFKIQNFVTMSKVWDNICSRSVEVMFWNNFVHFASFTLHDTKTKQRGYLLTHWWYPIHDVLLGKMITHVGLLWIPKHFLLWVTESAVVCKM